MGKLVSTGDYSSAMYCLILPLHFHLLWVQYQYPALRGHSSNIGATALHAKPVLDFNLSKSLCERSNTIVYPSGLDVVLSLLGTKVQPTEHVIACCKVGPNVSDNATSLNNNVIVPVYTSSRNETRLGLV